MAPTLRKDSVSSAPVCTVCDKSCAESGKKFCVENFLACAICKKLCHTHCSQLTAEDYACFLKNSDTQSWNCPNCRDFGKNFTTLESMFVQLMDAFKSTVQQQNVEISELKREISELKSVRSSNSPVQPNEQSFDMTVDAVAEHFERQERKMNVVIGFLPESIDTTKDQEFVENLVVKSGGKKEDIVDVFRLGSVRKDGKPRQTKVRFSSIWSKRSLLAGQAKLKTDAALVNSGFFVRHDLTAYQRQLDYDRRQELAKQREEFPDKQWVIRDNAIIEKPPVRRPTTKPSAGTAFASVLNASGLNASPSANSSSENSLSQV